MGYSSSDNFVIKRIVKTSLRYVGGRGLNEIAQHLCFEFSKFGRVWMEVLGWLRIKSVLAVEMLAHAQYFCDNNELPSMK